MATDVSICSNACIMLGFDPIASLDPPDNTPRAEKSANLYPQVRDWLLRSHPWNCAVRRVILPPEAAAPEFDWSYKFAQPSDWLRTLQVGQDGAPQDYQHESGFFLCDDNALYLRYVWQNTNAATYDSMLVHMLTLAMRAILAYPLTKSTSMMTECVGELAAELKRARSVDGQDNPPDTLGDFPLLMARAGAGTNVTSFFTR